MYTIILNYHLSHPTWWLQWTVCTRGVNLKIPNTHVKHGDKQNVHIIILKGYCSGVYHIKINVFKHIKQNMQ
jgi:hypothetical protein